MHDSLHFETMDFAPDGAPPVFNTTRLCKEGYTYYNYFIEVVDLRTIVLVNDEKSFRDIKKLFSDFYVESGKTSDYDRKERKV